MNRVKSFFSDFLYDAIALFKRLGWQGMVVVVMFGALMGIILPACAASLK